MRNGISFMANTENIIIDQESVGTKQLEAVDLMLCGRRKIFTAEDDINRDNIVSVLNDILSMHIFNYQQEEYLYWYRRGVQPILNRTREVRPELVKHVIVNNANQIVTFKNGYFMQEPCSYSSRIDDERVTPDALEFPQEDRKHIGIEIHSGQNRVVRRMFERVGYKVTKLDRVSFAGLTKKNVARGKYRFLTAKEVSMLQMGAFE